MDQTDDPILGALKRQAPDAWYRLSGVFGLIAGYAVHAWSTPNENWIQIAIGIGVGSAVALGLLAQSRPPWAEIPTSTQDDKKFAEAATGMNNILPDTAKFQASYGTRLAYPYIRSDQPFLTLRLGRRNHLFLTASRCWSFLDGGKNCGAFDRSEMSIEQFSRSLDTLEPEQDDEVDAYSWQHGRVDGGRDHRFKENRKNYEVTRFGFRLFVKDQLLLELEPMPAARAKGLYRNLKLLLEEQHTSDDGRSDQSSQEQTHSSGSEHHGSNSGGVEPWRKVLGVGSGATWEEVKAARKKKVWGLHPDRLKAIEGLSDDIEQFANAKLAEINDAFDRAKSEFGQA